MAALRGLVWVSFGLILLLDAYVATPISLGALYFAPLAVAALRLTPWDAYGLVAFSTAGRVFFGPAGDVLGLESLAVHLPHPTVLPVTGITAFVGYCGAAIVLRRLDAQNQRITGLHKAAETDPLTGLGNRRFLERALQKARREHAQLVVLALDVDHFKRLNDTYGHDGGDRVLQELARRVTKAVRQQDSVARVGGEEFVVLLAAAKGQDADLAAGRLLEAVRQRPFDVGSEQVPVTISAGLAEGPPDTDLLAKADRALYAAKAAGRDRFVRAE